MAVSKRTRFEVFKRDRFTCQYCGRTPPTVVLQIDHVIARSDGGPDDPLNLVTACEDCNLGKSDVPLDRITRPIAEQMAEAAERREQVAALNQFLLQEREAVEKQVADLGRHWFNKLAKKNRYVFGDQRAASIRTFLSRLPYARILEAIDAAHGRVPAAIDDDEKCWRYFCGVCWTMIRRAEAA